MSADQCGLTTTWCVSIFMPRTERSDERARRVMTPGRMNAAREKLRSCVLGIIKETRFCHLQCKEWRFSFRLPWLRPYIPLTPYTCSGHFWGHFFHWDFRNEGTNPHPEYRPVHCTITPIILVSRSSQSNLTTSHTMCRSQELTI